MNGGGAFFGRDVVTAETPVTRSAALAFAAAIGDTCSERSGELLAPPMFAVVPALPCLLAAKCRATDLHTLHGEHDLRSATEHRAGEHTGHHQRELHPRADFRGAEHVRIHHRRLGGAVGEMLDENVTIFEHPALHEHADDQPVDAGQRKQGEQNREHPDQDQAGRVKRNQKNSQVVHNAALQSWGIQVEHGNEFV